MVTQDDNEWVDVPGLPRPLTSTAVPKKGKTVLSRDGAVTLWLPSSIPKRLRSSSCVDGLATKEIVLRVADCSDSLHNIQRCLHELSIFSSYKSKNVDGQHVQTRALSTLKALRDKCDRYVARYRRSHVAWLALDPDQTFEGGKWKKVLRVLKQIDLIFPSDDEEAMFLSNDDDESRDEATNSAVHTKHGANGMGSNAKKRRGEGNKHLTWIWHVQAQDIRDIPGLDGSASQEDVYKRKIYHLISFNFTNVHLDLRIKWARARSRALCWDEEKWLLPEEMRRTITAHIGTHDQWLSRVNARSDVSTDINHRLDVYAHRQADIYWSLAVSFVNIWSPELRKNNITVDWLPDVADHAATVVALPERKSGCQKANATHTSDSENEDDAVESIRFRGLEGDTESPVDGEDSIESDGESFLQHLTGYTDSENSDSDDDF